MGSTAGKLEEKIRPLVQEAGLEIVDLKFFGAGPASVLRIYVDRAGGVTVEQCANLSRKVGDLLDMENLISVRYTLEVSSPGLDRPLCAREDFERKIGEKVKVFLKEAADGKTVLEGRIKSLKEDNLLLIGSSADGREDGEEWIIPLKNVARARIIF
jgi:ribosome maturation factor RimP